MCVSALSRKTESKKRQPDVEHAVVIAAAPLLAFRAGDVCSLQHVPLDVLRGPLGVNLSTEDLLKLARVSRYCYHGVQPLLQQRAQQTLGAPDVAGLRAFLADSSSKFNKGDAKAKFHLMDKQLARLPKDVEHARGYYAYEIHWYRGSDLVRGAVERFGSYGAMVEYAAKLEQRRRDKEERLSQAGTRTQEVEGLLTKHELQRRHCPASLVHAVERYERLGTGVTAATLDARFEIVQTLRSHVGDVHWSEWAQSASAVDDALAGKLALDVARGTLQEERTEREAAVSARHQ